MNKKEKSLSYDLLRRLVSYDPKTGLFTRKLVGAKGGSLFKPKNIKIGKTDDRGYERIYINNEYFRSHRLAWFYCNGQWPNGSLDHVDRNKLNNRIDNLRVATQRDNTRNTKARLGKCVPYKGVIMRPEKGSYRAKIMKNKKQTSLGEFKTPEEAARAYDKAAKEEFGEFAYLNFPDET